MLGRCIYTVGIRCDHVRSVLDDCASSGEHQVMRNHELTTREESHSRHGFENHDGVVMAGAG